MKEATHFKLLAGLMALSIFCTVARPQSQSSRSRPTIGVALLTREGAPSAAAIGCLKALDELGIPVDRIFGSHTGGLIASLYATRHSYQEMAEAISELREIYSDRSIGTANYASDFRVRRFLTLYFGKFDVVARNDFDRLPIPFRTAALDLVSGKQFVFSEGSLAQAVRASLGSPLFLEPSRNGEQLFIGSDDPAATLLRRAGAEVVIIIIDSFFQSPIDLSEHGQISKLSVADYYRRASESETLLKELANADVVIHVDTHEFSETSIESVEPIVERGYQSALARKKLLEQLSIASQAAKAQKDVVDASYQKLLVRADDQSIASVLPDGNYYVPAPLILDLANLKVGDRFNLPEAVKSLDRVYASGFFRTCWLDLQETQPAQVAIRLRVVESEFLPPDALPKLEQSLKRSSAEERRFAAAAIGNLGSKAKQVLPQLAALLSDDNRRVRSASVHAIGAMGREARPELTDILNLLKKESESSVRRDAAWAISRIAVGLRTKDDLQVIGTLQESARVLGQDSDLAEYAESVQLSLKSLEELRTALVENSDNRYAIADDELRSWLSGSSEVTLNGQSIELRMDSHQGQVQFLGADEKNAVRQGINRMVRGREELLFWVEERKLAVYQNPYRKSYAIIVAIDDYDRKRDTQHRSPTGYPALSAMVTNAQKLAEVLKRLGFPSENIIRLYDEQASSDRITAVLESFWPGGAFAQADRVLFYFGGHGDKSGSNPYLATYNFDKEKPTLTSVLMKDLTERHSQNISAKHVLFALDACDSGLTLKTLGNTEALDQRLRRFQALSLIRRDTEQVARNILVAGTGDQRALWQNGGVFTKALIDGLSGEADLNQDGIIQFEELGVYIRDRVTAQAAQAAVRQDPEFRILDQYGSGRIVFVK
jgi:predicted acylesterase/phospholipase RssA